LVDEFCLVGQEVTRLQFTVGDQVAKRSGDDLGSFGSVDTSRGTGGNV
jgi:hypothetical protein